MDDKDLARWAARMAKKGIKGAVTPAAVAAQAAPAAPAAPRRPPERWGAPPSDAPVPMRHAAPGTTWSPRAPDSNVLVRPGPSAWDTMLNGVPDLAPDTGYDSMNDQVSPESAAAMREAGVAINPASVRDNDRAPRGFSSAPSTSAVAPLKDLPPGPGAGQLTIPGTGESN